ncbi:hypothetical protein B0H19DRAFT_1067848 [Mycena capillaripes]|nr:hypothetical protein B0H19DRAFT_1067848 [Mycena capillaripes]
MLVKTSAPPSPSPSSHASSIMRVALHTPSPSPARCPGAYDTSKCDGAWDAITSSTSPAPIYHFYGLANTVSEDSESGGRRVEHIAAFSLPVPQATAQRSDVFGLVGHNLTAVQHHKRRRTGAKLAAHVQRVRTALWVGRLCRDIARGGMLVEDNHSS